MLFSYVIQLCYSIMLISTLLNPARRNLSIILYP